MAGQIKNLTFSEGVSVTSPTGNAVEASALIVATSDANFLTVTAKGSPSAGDIYWNSTVEQVRVNDGTTWFNVPKRNVVSKTLDYTAQNEDEVILVDATSGNVTIDLPTSTTTHIRRYFIKKTDSGANTVTIDPDASETIDGDSTLVLSSENDSVLIQSDGSNYFVMAQKLASSGTSQTITKFNSTTTIGGDVDVALCDSASGDITLTLPAASSATRRIHIRKIDTSGNKVVIDPNGGDNLDGSSSNLELWGVNEGLIIAADTAVNSWHVTAHSFQQVAILRHARTNTTDAGTPTASTYTTQPLNDQVLGTTDGTWITMGTPTVDATYLSGNRVDDFTLEKGSYWVTIRQFFSRADSGRIRLRNTTDSSTPVLGTNTRTRNTDDSSDWSQGTNVFTISAQKTFELQYYLVNAQLNALGQSVNSGDAEVYAEIIIQRVYGR